MGETQGITKLLDAPAGVLDAIGKLLSHVGIDLPPLILQLFLLAIVVAFAIPVVKRVRSRARKKSNRLPLVYAVALALVCVGLLAGIADNASMPPSMTGQIKADRLESLRVSLLDHRGKVISVDSGVVDTGNGRFALHYNPLWDGRARKLRIGADRCKPLELEVFRAHLRAGSDQIWSYSCDPA